MLQPLLRCEEDERQRLQLTIRLSDYSGSPSTAVEKARRAAEMPFGVAGIHLRWLDCPITAGSQAAPVPECDAPSRPTDLRVIVLPERMARKMAARSGQFGMAILNDGGFSNHSYVFAERALNMATESRGQWKTILGHLVAHEIGHLLLGTNGHSQTGIMRSNWKSADIKAAMMGRLSFTPDQVHRIRGEVLRRMGNAGP
jgi:hypothetical protein